MLTPPPAHVGRRRLRRACVALLVLAALAVYLLVQYLTGGPGVPRCTVTSQGKGGRTYQLDPEQAANAATVSAVGSSRGLPERAVTIALATAMQESGLRNLGYGDRDSLGLFQQRPSQDWGSERQIMDPVYSADEFYAHLVKVQDYAQLPLTDAAQRVQHSAYPTAYAKHESNAALLAGALTGRDGPALSCAQAPPVGNQRPGGVRGIRAELVREFGRSVLPETAGASSSSPPPPPSPSPSGGRGAGAGRSELEVPVRGGRAAGGTRRGWELATWAMAHSSDLRIEQISYAGRTWTAADSGKGWQPSDTGAGKTAGSATAGVRIVAAQ